MCALGVRVITKRWALFIYGQYSSTVRTRLSPNVRLVQEQGELKIKYLSRQLGQDAQSLAVNMIEQQVKCNDTASSGKFTEKSSCEVFASCCQPNELSSTCLQWKRIRNK